MEKRTYIQPEMRIDGMNANDSLMQLVLGSPTGPEPGKTQMPVWRPKNPTRTPVF